MSKYTEKYKKIIDQLIKKSFPKLRNEDVKVYEIPKSLVWWVHGFVFCNSIIVTTRVRKFDKKTQIGFFAHELCHVESYVDLKKRSFFIELFGFIWVYLSWAFYASSSKRRERKTGLKVIKKGYARELYHFAVVREKRYSKMYRHGYLSSKQIKAYAQKIGKW
jgi:hypothetical protein